MRGVGGGDEIRARRHGDAEGAAGVGGRFDDRSEVRVVDDHVDAFQRCEGRFGDHDAADPAGVGHGVIGDD